MFVGLTNFWPQWGEFLPAPLIPDTQVIPHGAQRSLSESRRVKMKERKMKIWHWYSTTIMRQIHSNKGEDRNNTSEEVGMENGHVELWTAVEWDLWRYKLRVSDPTFHFTAGFCEHGDEPSGSIKKAGFFWQAEWQWTSQIIFCTME
jgi:hypothetical protein